jgi:hypothetical protein
MSDGNQGTFYPIIDLGENIDGIPDIDVCLLAYQS